LPKTYPTYDITHKKSETEFFFTAASKTCHIFGVFEQLSSTIDWQVLELQSGRKIAQKHVLNA